MFRGFALIFRFHETKCNGVSFLFLRSQLLVKLLFYELLSCPTTAQRSLKAYVAYSRLKNKVAGAGHQARHHTPGVKKKEASTAPPPSGGVTAGGLLPLLKLKAVTSCCNFAQCATVSGCVPLLNRPVFEKK